MPERVQLRRTKGWKLPEGAISVARPGKWGNPFRVARAEDAGYVFDSPKEGRAFVVACFEDWLTKGNRSQWWFGHGADAYAYMSTHIRDLRGHDLACWCPLDQPCHADVLLRIANS